MQTAAVGASNVDGVQPYVAPAKTMGPGRAVAVRQPDGSSKIGVVTGPCAMVAGYWMVEVLVGITPEGLGIWEYTSCDPSKVTMDRETFPPLTPKEREVAQVMVLKQTLLAKKAAHGAQA